MRHLKPNEERFLEYLMSNYSCSNGPNKEAMALFAAIQFAFKNNVVNQNEAIRVPWELVEFLAACACAALESELSEEIPWDKSDGDYILPRALSAFVAAIWLAQKEDQLVRREDKIFLGTFEVPEWFEFWNIQNLELADVVVG